MQNFLCDPDHDYHIRLSYTFQSIAYYGSKTKTIQPNMLPQRADKMFIKKYHFKVVCALCQIEMTITTLPFLEKLGMLNI